MAQFVRCFIQGGRLDGSADMSHCGWLGQASLHRFVSLYKTYICIYIYIHTHISMIVKTKKE